MKRILSVISPVVLAGLLFACLQPDAEGCASLPRSNRPEDSIRIAEESAIIVWDSKNKIEHFIRRAGFDTKSPDFGFLVPTPTIPILAEAKDLLFREAGQWILPKTVDQYRVSFAPVGCSIGCASRPASRMEAAKNGVRVLAEQNVGGFEAKILQADDADEFAKWIKDHGYSTDPELYAWLTPYVAAKWKITAFKIVQDLQTGVLATTRPVRMSFTTERPFFPYREPEAKAAKPNQGSRVLRVFFVSDTRMEGKIGNGAAWHAKVSWSDELVDEQRALLAKYAGMAEGDLPAKPWMTAFEDNASPRPGTDEVYFDAAQARTPIRPPPFIRYSEIRIPADLLVLAAIFAGLFIWKKLRARASKRFSA